MSAPRLTSAEKRAILDAYAAGVKITAIAHQFGIHHTYPAHLARRCGMPRRTARRRTTDIIQFMAATGTERDIAARFGLHFKSIYRLKKAAAALLG